MSTDFEKNVYLPHIIDRDWNTQFLTRFKCLDKLHITSFKNNKIHKREVFREESFLVVLPLIYIQLPT